MAQLCMSISFLYPRSLVTPLEVLRSSVIIMVLQITKSLKIYFEKAYHLIAVWGIALVGAAELLAPYITKLFVGYDAKLHAMTQTGFRICCLVYLINGFNIFGSSFFTALNNGPLSALISFLRTLIFQIAAVLLLPLLFGIMGIWWSINAAELLTLCVTLMLLFTMRGRYHYA